MKNVLWGFSTNLLCELINWWPFRFVWFTIGIPRLAKTVFNSLNGASVYERGYYNPLTFNKCSTQCDDDQKAEWSVDSTKVKFISWKSPLYHFANITIAHFSFRDHDWRFHCLEKIAKIVNVATTCHDRDQASQKSFKIHFLRHHEICSFWINDAASNLVNHFNDAKLQPELLIEYRSWIM